MRYAKETSRLTVKFIDSDTEETLFEVKDRNWMNVGEIFADVHVDNIIKQNIGNRPLPKNMMVIVVGDYSLVE